MFFQPSPRVGAPDGYEGGPDMGGLMELTRLFSPPQIPPFYPVGIRGGGS